MAILYRVSWPDEKIIVTRLQDLHSEIRKHKLTRTTLILVSEAIGGERTARVCTTRRMRTFFGGEVVSAKVLLLSGASEGPVLARALLDAGFTVSATVTTAEGKAHLFGAMQQALTVLVGGFTEASLTDFLARGEADLVLDATHPFAVRITRMASAVCATLRVPYVRYQRPDWEPPAGTVYAASYAEAAALLPTWGHVSC